MGEDYIWCSGTGSVSSQLFRIIWKHTNEREAEVVRIEERSPGFEVGSPKEHFMEPSLIIRVQEPSPLPRPSFPFFSFIKALLQHLNIGQGLS